MILLKLFGIDLVKSTMFSLRLTFPILKKVNWYGIVLYFDKAEINLSGLHKRFEDALTYSAFDISHMSCLSKTTTIREFCTPIVYRESAFLKTYIFWNGSFCVQKVLEATDLTTESYYCGHVLSVDNTTIYNGYGCLIAEKRVVFAITNSNHRQKLVFKSGKKHNNTHLYTYKGHFILNQKNGNGILEFSNGMVYTGSWKNDTLQGKCLIRYIDGDEVYGEFENGRLKCSQD
jgi:hypothetical protein